MKKKFNLHNKSAEYSRLCLSRSNCLKTKSFKQKNPVHPWQGEIPLLWIMFVWWGLSIFIFPSGFWKNMMMNLTSRHKNTSTSAPCTFRFLFLLHWNMWSFERKAAPFLVKFLFRGSFCCFFFLFVCLSFFRFTLNAYNLHVAACEA